MIFPAYITTIFFAIFATIPKSCVIRMIAMFSSFCSFFSNSIMSACIVTSKAVVGSSAITICGLQASAMAIMTLWRIPPENSWGYWCIRFPGFGIPTSPSILSASAQAWPLSIFWCSRRFSATCLPTFIVGFRDVSASWNIIEHSAPRYARHSFSSYFKISFPLYQIWLPSLTSPGGVCISPIMLLAVTDLPHPDSPTIASVSPSSTANETPLTDCTSPA